MKKTKVLRLEEVLEITGLSIWSRVILELFSIVEEYICVFI
ncbi:hypothetical protein [Clostridium sp.]